MPKNLWECSKDGCGEKSIVAEDVIPKGWCRVEIVYRCPGTPDLEKYKLFEDDKSSDDLDSSSCVVYDHIEACCTEHAIEIARETLEGMLPVSEGDNE